MKFLPILLINLFLFISLNANDDFSLIKPISIEVSQVQRSVVAKPLDDDSDGVLNRDDKCPNTKNGENVNKFGCLVKDDIDNDGVPDKDDKCPNTIKGAGVDTQGCELDSDNDGIVDSKDECPNTSTEFVVDGYGCPQTATLNINFNYKKYNISDELIDGLKEFALFLKENNGYQVVIYGYTDSVGTKKSNKILSQKRANAIKESLMRYGISITRLTAIGMGEENPIADNESEDGKASNRRIEVELIR